MGKFKFICRNCAWAILPRGNAKIKAGQCFTFAHNDIMPINILPTTKACFLFEKKKPKKRWWKKKPEMTIID